jgi:asparagine synthase (glutamine-hydrolysing)
MLGLLRHCSQADVECVNEYWEDAPEGDERDQARCVTQRLGLRLHELRCDPAAVIYERALAAPLTARPTLAVLGHADRNIAPFYASLGCELVTSGQGGDHLFHRSRTPWIAADAVCDGVPPGVALDIAIDTARLTGKAVWDVFAVMLAGLVGLRPEAARPSTVMGALADGETIDLARPDHAWLRGVRRASPARTLRIHHLLHALSYFEDTSLSAVAKVEPLLLSQPIMEVCLTIPPYVMTQGGIERALARSAFADLAPVSVTRRVTKGETTRYFATVLAMNEDWIRSALIEGRLVATGVIDRSAIKSALDRNWIQNAIAADGLYALIAAECWLRALDRRCAEARSAAA